MKIRALTNRISVLPNLFFGRNPQKTTSNLLKYGLVLLSIVTLWGCGKSNGAAPPAIDPVTKKHQTGWVAVGTGGAHPTAYLANPANCVGCHGAPGDFAGGISKISCSSGVIRNGIQCHANFPHQVGFGAPDAHGPKAKSPLATGFATCMKCHGADFKGSGAAPSCIACHLSKATYVSEGAPHSPAPWRGTTRTHVDTDPSNAVVCANCHTSGAHTPIARKDLVAHAAITAATPPDCYNNTLCHGVEGHQNDPQPWTKAANHGARAKINLGGCRACHATGTNPPVFNVPQTNMAKGCQTCHTQTGLAHPYIWLLGTTQTTHATTTNLAINSYCIMCHGPNLNNPFGAVPSCFAPYPNNSPAGVAFKCHATNPVNNTNCTSCHGASTTGPNGSSFPNTANAHPKHTAIAGVTCTTCHNGAGSGTPRHASGATAVSLLPSQAGATATYDPAAKTCANVTCHRGITTPAWYTANANLGCTICHTPPPSTFRHPKHLAIPNITCTTCHKDGPGVPGHSTTPGNAAVIGFPGSAPNFNENGLTAGYDAVAGKCANLSCHGGKLFGTYLGTQIQWKNTQGLDPTVGACATNCHTVSTFVPALYSGVPYIGPFSGNNIVTNGIGNNLHQAHTLALGPAVCTDCHTLATHFNSLMLGNRTLVSGFAAGTIAGAKIQNYKYNIPSDAQRTCFTNDTVNCHGSNVLHTWFK